MQRRSLSRSEKFWRGICIGLAFALSIYILQPFLLTLCVGGMFAIALIPAQTRFIHKFKIRRALATTLVFAFFLALILSPVTFILIKIISAIDLEKNSRFINEISRIESRASEAIISKAESLHISVDGDFIRELSSRLAIKINSLLTGAATYMVTHLPEMIVQFTIMVLTTLVVLVKHRQIATRILSLSKSSEQMFTELFYVLSEASQNVVFTNILTGVFQAALVALGISIFTEYDAALVFVAAFIFSFIPLLGASSLPTFAAIAQIYDGQLAKGVSLILVAVIVGVSDNILRAWLMTKKKEDSSFLNLLACIGGIYAWGLPGLFVGPLVVGIAVRIIPLFAQEISFSNNNKSQVPGITIVPNRRTLRNSEVSP